MVCNIWIIIPYIGNVIIPTDEVHHFSEGLVETTNQMCDSWMKNSRWAGIWYLIEHLGVATYVWYPSTEFLEGGAKEPHEACNCYEIPKQDLRFHRNRCNTCIDIALPIHRWSHMYVLFMIHILYYIISYYIILYYIILYYIWSDMCTV